MGTTWRFLVSRPQWALMAFVRFYRYWFKPWLGNACRFEPTCSAYALKALQDHGAAVGAILSTARLLRCHPWCAGGHDPVPERLTGLDFFTRRPRALFPELSETAPLAVQPTKQQQP